MLAAYAARDQAKLNLARTVVRAPADGYASQTQRLQVGNMVIQSRKPILGIRQSVLRLAGARLPRAKDHIQVKNPVTGDCLHFEVTSAEPDAEGDVQVHLIKAP